MLHIFAESLKFSAFMLFGFILAFPVSAAIGVFEPFVLILPIAWEVGWRLGLGLLCLATVTVLWEGLRKRSS